jgi:hypothetical protein
MIFTIENATALNFLAAIDIIGVNSENYKNRKSKAIHQQHDPIWFASLN